MKKVSYLLIACLLLMVTSVYADDVMIYEQAFDGYTGGRFEELNATAGLGKWTALPSNQYLEDGADEDGNVYMYFVNDNDDATIVATYQFNEVIDEGVVVFNYDIAHSGEASTVPRIRIFDKDFANQKYFLFMNGEQVCGPKADFNSNVGFTGAVEYKNVPAGTPISVTQVLNFDEDYFVTYIDGEFLERVDDLPFDHIGYWGIYGYNTVSYLDNISIKILEDVDMSVSVTGTEGGGTGLSIVLPECVSEDVIEGITAANIVVTDKNNNPVALLKDSVSVSGTTVSADFESSLGYDETYTVKLSNIKDMYDRSFGEKTFISNSEIDENGNKVVRVVSVVGTTLDGEQVELVDGVTPQISKITINFNTYIETANNGVLLNNEPLEGELSERTFVAELDDVLVGNKTYNITINENVKSPDLISARDYEQSFKTAVGSFEVKAFQWLNSEGNVVEASQITAGTALKLKLCLVNTTASKENLFVSYSSFKENKQKAVMFLPIELKSGGYGEYELDYTVIEDGEEIKGILFDNFNALTPIVDFVTVR